MTPSPTLAKGSAASAGMTPNLSAWIDRAATRFVGTGPDPLAPGAVVLVTRRAVIVEFSARGYAQTHDGERKLACPRPMRPDSIFDVASVTKVAATTAAVMRLVDEGGLDLDDAVNSWLPEFSGADKERITLRLLLSHRAGLWEWWPLYLSAGNFREAIRGISTLDLRYPPDSARHYSDLGFMLLGEILQRSTGEPLAPLVRRLVHEPLGMNDTRYGPISGPTDRLVATSTGNPFERRMIETGEPYPVEGDADGFTGWRGYTLAGEVNDGNAFHAFGGAGHAGLFSTARDLATLGQTLLNGGAYGEFRLCSPETVEEFTRDHHGEGQGLGFRIESAPLPDGGSVKAYGHGGFTGTDLTVIPDLDMIVVLLTNRQHPHPPYKSIESLRNAILHQALTAAR